MPGREQGLIVSRRCPVSFAVFTVARSHRGFAAELLSDLGLYPGQELVLMHLWEQDGQSQNALTGALGLDHSTIVRSVQRMEANGLVHRTRSVEDGRVNLVFLTDRGRELRTRTMAVWDELERRTIERLTTDEQAQFVGLVEKIISTIDT